MLLKSDTKKLQKGDSAPNFRLKNVDESMVSLDDFSDQVLVVIFMCNHCPYVKPKMDEIAAIQNDYAPRGVSVVCINSNDPADYPDDDFAHMQSLAEDKGYNYYLVDETQNIAREYGATCTPDPFVFDSNHKLVYHGRINDALNPDDPVTNDILRDVLEKVLSNQDVEEWFLPSMGCSIKWK